MSDFTSSAEAPTTVDTSYSDNKEGSCALTGFDTGAADWEEISMPPQAKPQEQEAPKAIPEAFDLGCAEPAKNRITNRTAKPKPTVIVSYPDKLEVVYDSMRTARKEIRKFLGGKYDTARIDIAVQDSRGDRVD
jgi:hypothetical protein